MYLFQIIIYVFIIAVYVFIIAVYGPKGISVLFLAIRTIYIFLLLEVIFFFLIILRHFEKRISESFKISMIKIMKKADA